MSLIEIAFYIFVILGMIISYIRIKKAQTEKDN